MKDETMQALTKRDEIKAALGQLEDEEERINAKRATLLEELKAVTAIIRADDDLAEATGRRVRRPRGEGAPKPAKKRGAKEGSQ